MVSQGRTIICKEFGDRQCQTPQREQCPLAFGVLVSFLSSFLSFTTRMKGERGREREISRKITVRPLAIGPQVHGPLHELEAGAPMSSPQGVIETEHT